MPDPKDGGKWGILGGTYDPVHCGHLILADQIRKKKNLGGVLLVPSMCHPFKADACVASFDQRVMMLILSLREYDGLLISTIEKDKDLSGFTLDTVSALETRYPSCEFFFLMGADNISQLEKWHRPDLILEKIPILAGCRPGSNPEEDLNKLKLDKSRIELVETEHKDISSNEIKSLIENSDNYDSLDEKVPPSVLMYIKENNLYR